MTVTCGEEHVFLGMKLRFPSNGTVHIIMKEYIEEAIDLFREKLDRIVATPATSSLFILDPNAKALSVERKERIHSIVSKLMWVFKRGRPDVDVTVAYLCTRVSVATTDDWKKLRRRPPSKPYSRGWTHHTVFTQICAATPEEPCPLAAESSTPCQPKTNQELH